MDKLTLLKINNLRMLFTFCILLTAFNQEANSTTHPAHCNMSVMPFLNAETGIITIPSQIEGKKVRSITALFHFRETHGAFRSCFSLKNIKSNQITDIFCEIKFSDRNMRGDDQWLGTKAGGVLGDAPDVMEETLEPDNEYTLLVSGNFFPHKVDLRSAKTNFRDPEPDGNDKLFTFKIGTRRESISLLGTPEFSTIFGFDDGYLKQGQVPNYNDFIIEMCLQVDY